MNPIIRAVALSVLISPLVAPAQAASPSAAPMPAQTVALHVVLDAGGHVQSSTPVDPATAPALLNAARAYAAKLNFTPARKDGVAVASETNLSLVLAMQPAGDGKVALVLKRAVNGPGVLTVGRMDVPKYQGRGGGATIVVGVNVDANGVPDSDSFTADKVQLREPNKFAEARYLDAIRVSVRGSRFAPDKVAGAAVPSRLSLPYRFGMGGNKPKDGEDESGRGKKPTPPDPSNQPTLTAISSVPGIDLPKIEYTAPAAN